MKIKIIKGLTLVTFLGLISGFVAFQSGCKLMRTQESVPLSTDENVSNNGDTSAYKVVEKKKPIMSSSKSFNGEGFKRVELDTIYQDTVPKR